MKRSTRYYSTDIVLPLLLILLLIGGLPSCNNEAEDIPRLSSPEKQEEKPADTARSQKDTADVIPTTITVTSPPPSQSIPARSFTIRGSVKQPMGEVRYRLFYQNRIALAGGSLLQFDTASKGKSSDGSFSKKVDYTTDWGGEGNLEIYQIDSTSHQEMPLATIPVTIPGPTPDSVLITKDPSNGKNKREEVFAYFSNSRLGSMRECNSVYPLGRYLPQGAKSAPLWGIYFMLLDVTPEEREDGYTTRLPEGLRLNSLNLEDGVIRVDFNNALTRIKRGCDIDGARAQIEQTMAQFRNINAVVISVEGRIWTPH